MIEQARAADVERSEVPAAASPPRKRRSRPPQALSRAAADDWLAHPAADPVGSDGTRAIAGPRFFPAPSSIMGTFMALLGSGQLLSDVRDTLTRVFVGLVLGGIPGLVIGAAMGLSPLVRAFFKPVVAALFPIPKIAVLPLIFLIFGLGEESKYVSVSIGIVFLMLINTMAGVLAIDRIYFDVGKNFGANRWQFFRTIAVPGAMPGIITGLQLSLTIALLICVATEFVGAKSGLGYLIWNSWQTFSVATMYSGLVVCALLGVLFQVSSTCWSGCSFPGRTGGDLVKEAIRIGSVDIAVARDSYWAAAPHPLARSRQERNPAGAIRAVYRSSGRSDPDRLARTVLCGEESGQDDPAGRGSRRVGPVAVWRRPPARRAGRPGRASRRYRRGHPEPPAPGSHRLEHAPRTRRPSR